MKPALEQRSRFELILINLAFGFWLTACGIGNKASTPPPLTSEQLSSNISAQVVQGNYSGAVAVANTLLKRYPDSIEAASLMPHMADWRLQAEKQAAAQAANLAKEATVKTSAANHANDVRLETCRSSLKAAQKLDVLYDLQLNDGTAKVVVGPTFFNMPIDAKQGFVKVVNCFLVAGSNNVTTFDILDWRTGKAVGEYKFGRFTML